MECSDPSFGGSDGDRCVFCWRAGLREARRVPGVGKHEEGDGRGRNNGRMPADKIADDLGHGAVSVELQQLPVEGYACAKQPCCIYQGRVLRRSRSQHVLPRNYANGARERNRRTLVAQVDDKHGDSTVRSAVGGRGSRGAVSIYAQRKGILFWSRQRRVEDALTHDACPCQSGVIIWEWYTGRAVREAVIRADEILAAEPLVPVLGLRTQGVGVPQRVAKVCPPHHAVVAGWRAAVVRPDLPGEDCDVGVLGTN
mmetsp:Transcript_84182/g.238507  ORF Transcript_84182/g.238507 Transcript_84182/m.238507 type:complete len:255 (+) Transcript_84182:164-928(+)